MSRVKKSTKTTSIGVATISVKSRGYEILPPDLLQVLPPELRETPLQVGGEITASHHLLLAGLRLAIDPSDLRPSLVTLAEQTIRSMTDEA